MQERSIVEEIRRHVAGPDFEGEMKTIECAIMDIADDIAYSTYDLEDAFKGGFLSPLSIIAMPDDAKSNIVGEVKKKIDEYYGDLSEQDRVFTLKEYNATIRRIFSGVLNVQLPDSLFEVEFDIDEYNATLVSATSSISDNLCQNGHSFFVPNLLLV